MYGQGKKKKRSGGYPVQNVAVPVGVSLQRVVERSPQLDERSTVSASVSSTPKCDSPARLERGSTSRYIITNAKRLFPLETLSALRAAGGPQVDVKPVVGGNRGRQPCSERKLLSPRSPSALQFPQEGQRRWSRAPKEQQREQAAISCIFTRRPLLVRKQKHQASLQKRLLSEYRYQEKNK